LVVSYGQHKKAHFKFTACAAGHLFALQRRRVCEVLTCCGTSDASAGAAVSENMFVAADDENNTLRIYQIDNPTNAVFSVDLTEFLAAASKNPEADIEGATAIGNRIYWITSHGRNKDGKMRPSRYRFSRRI
jgi:hypothetical protein